MHRIPPLEISDHYSCDFLLFEPVFTLWKKAAGEVNSEPVVVVDSNVLHLHRDTLKKTFPPNKSRYIEIPAGEASKSMDRYRRVVDNVFSGPVRRNTPLIAVGGGVTGDLAGFLAATLMRGLPLYHIPTTLLAMVDSAVGGKTGINHPFGKNTIGSFYHPRAVLFDTAFLDTLPQREWLCGISEVLKYGYIQDPELLQNAVQLAQKTGRNPELLMSVIESSVRIKSSIVSRDARESGIRSWLNFGHTFAHALETLDEYRNINHGEAVYAGMIAALYVSSFFGASVSDKALLDLKSVYNLDLKDYEARSGELVALMGHDKKNIDSSIRLVLLDDIGKPVLKKINDRSVLLDAWNYVFQTLSFR